MSGIVKWYLPHKGYGFISGEDGKDYFVHQTEIRIDGYRKLKRNQEVTFSLGTDRQGRPVAIDVIP